MSTNKKYYDNGSVILVSSEPAVKRRRHTRDRMNRVKSSSQTVLKVLEEISIAYPQNSDKR